MAPVTKAFKVVPSLKQGRADQWINESERRVGNRPPPRLRGPAVLSATADSANASVNWGRMSRRREELVPGQPNVILFECYVCRGNDERVHIDVQSKVRLNELEALTRKLSTGEVKTIHLSEIEGARWVPPLADVVLTASARGSEVRNRLRGERLVCEWRESLEGWLESTEKIAVMIASPTPCHQYFEGTYVDSVTIELAYLE